MAWEANPNLDYSATGDDIDTASQKIIAMFIDVYDKLNRLRSVDASAGASVGDATPYAFKIDTSVNPPALLMRNATNTGYITIGSIAENWGIDAQSVGTIASDGNIGSIKLGQEALIPSTGTTYDLYFAYDTGRLYMYLTGAWRVFLSLRPEDFIGLENFAIMRDEVAENGAEKVPRLNSVGQGEFDITGSPGKLGGKNMYLPSIQDGQVLVFNGERDRWEVAPRDDVKLSDLSTTGEANKVVKADAEGKIHIDTTGNAGRIAQVAIDANNLAEDDVLAYDSTAGTFKNKPRNDINNADLTTTGEADKVVKVHSDGTIHANVTGSATKVDNVTVNMTGAVDKDLLYYDNAAKELKPKSFIQAINDVTTTTGEPGKIVKVDPSDGFIHGNVQGYSTGVTGVPVDMTGLTEDSVLAYDSTQHKLVPRRRGAIQDEDIAHTEADIGKVVVLNENGMIPFSVTGNAAKILNKTVVSGGLEDGQILVYRTATQTWNVENKGTVGAGKTLILRNSGELIATYDGSETTNVDLHEVIDEVAGQQIDEAIAVAYKDGGSKAFAQLPALTAENRGYVYNVTDAFTTTADFVEGAGHDYPAGTNVTIALGVEAHYALTEDTTAAEGKTYYSDNAGTEVDPQPNKGADISNAGYYELIPAHYVPTEDTTAQEGKTYYSDDEGTEVAPQPTAGDDISEAGYYELVLAEYVLTEDHYAKAGKTYYRSASGAVLSPQPPKGDDISEAGYYELVASTFKYDVLSSIPQATSTTAGVTKLYNTTGTNADGAITQAEATSHISTLESDMATAQSDIVSLQNAMTMTYKAKGSVAFANLPATLDATKLGWVYNVYDDFTTDSRFVEGAGSEYFAGENVVIVEVSPDEYVATADETAIAGKTYYANAQGEELITQPTGGDYIGDAGYYELVDNDYVPTEDEYAKAGKTYYADGVGTALDTPPTGGDDISQAGYYEFHEAVYKFDVLTGYIDLSDYPRVSSFDPTTGTLVLTTL